MILVWLIAILIVGGVAAWAAARSSHLLARWISLVAISVDFAIALWLWARYFHQISLVPGSSWLTEINLDWIPNWGVRFHLAIDGLSLLLILLTLFLGIVSVLASWREIQDAVGFFHLNLLWVLAGIVGVFLAVDLFLF